MLLRVHVAGEKLIERPFVFECGKNSVVVWRHLLLGNYFVVFEHVIGKLVDHCVIKTIEIV